MPTSSNTKGSSRKDRETRAKEHLQAIKARYPDEISACIQATRVYRGPLPTAPDISNQHPLLQLYQTDAVSLLFRLREGEGDVLYNGKTAKLCLLNFASFRHPGGGFLSGSMAQEEALCHESILYPILDSFRDTYFRENENLLNSSLYDDAALYTPDILFMRDNKTVLCDVLTCAAPNFKAAVCRGVTKEQNSAALSRRFQFIRSILSKERPAIFITGAWGCGVFGQDPSEVAQNFLDMAQGSGLRAVLAAVPGDKNYQPFADIWEREGSST